MSDTTHEALSATLGKIAPAFFDAAIAPHLGAARPEVLVGPGSGRDCAIVRIGAGRVLAVTTDPLSVVPAWGLERSARLSCHLLASDLWTSGIPPAYASVSLHLAPALTDGELESYWAAMSGEWSKLGVAVVAGHTGRYEGSEGSVIGAATLIGVGDEGRYLTPAMARLGDRLILTKGCAIEATAVAAHLFPARLGGLLDSEGLARARALAERVSVVEDCRAALQAGVHDQGVTSLHDATEGGVFGGLLEVAAASGHDLRVERSKIPVSAEARAACQAFGGIDPYWALSEGTLIATVRPDRAPAVLAALAEAGSTAAEIGEVMAGHGKLWVTEADGHVTTITESVPDPYWPAYERAVREGWR